MKKDQSLDQRAKYLRLMIVKEKARYCVDIYIYVHYN